MPTKTNPIDTILDNEANTPSTKEKVKGQISEILKFYEPNKSERLLGFLLNMGYDEMCLVTCDAWKANCGGLPKNSFVIVKVNEEVARPILPGARDSLILARVTETTMTPVATDIQNTIFQIHKVQANIDPLTNVELQWGALKANILGTYYDEKKPDGKMSIEFGNDIDNFVSPHFYEIYVPTDEHLEKLINTFVKQSNPITIGRLRYTETETLGKARQIKVQVSPADFIANRTALFGKTRMGKSNTIKVILDTMLSAFNNLGQIVFDLSGEYTYPDPQTGASIYLRHKDKCSRYSLKPRKIEREKNEGVDPPAMLKTNFFEQIELGHAIVQHLYDTFHPRRPDYIAPFLAWEPVDYSHIKERFPDEGDQVRYKRSLSMYLALLHEAGFEAPKGTKVRLEITKELRQRLVAIPGVEDFADTTTDKKGKLEVADLQEIGKAATLYTHLWLLYDSNRDDAKLFKPSSRSGKPYFESIHECLLRMIGDTNISGAKKLTPFKDYHDPKGANVVNSIVRDVEGGKTVLLDLANADPVVASYYSKMIANSVLAKQMAKFSSMATEDFEKHSVLFYFEEAHNLFRADDKDLTSVYNKLAKEGAKFRIGMVYATQSMTTLSPDLLKNTENFFIAHLNDDREIREIERRYEFSGIGLDVQRARSKGYVRMITLSHRYALPVQVRLFAPNNEA